MNMGIENRKRAEAQAVGILLQLVGRPYAANNAGDGL